MKNTINASVSHNVTAVTKVTMPFRVWNSLQSWSLDDVHVAALVDALAGCGPKWSRDRNTVTYDRVSPEVWHLVARVYDRYPLGAMADFLADYVPQRGYSHESTDSYDGSRVVSYTLSRRADSFEFCDLLPVPVQLAFVGLGPDNGNGHPIHVDPAPIGMVYMRNGVIGGCSR